MKTNQALITAPLLIALLFPAPTAVAADCTKACLAVTVENGQIVVSGQKGNGPKSTKVVKKVTAVKKVAPKKPVIKRVVLKQPSAVVATRKPVVKKKRVVTKKAVAATSIADRLTKLLPTGGVAFQPAYEPLVHVPVVFWCDLPKIFSTRFNIVGEVVDVTLRPSFSWSFGDGSVMQSTDPGAPYPNGSIQHAYLKEGTYLVTMLATWGGTWSNQGTIRAVTGEIKTIRVATVKVVSAPTMFVQ
ncbi:PKD domain containing protein [Candidatus Nanopelagicaceae bacterium]|jgi:hypothetical protein